MSTPQQHRQQLRATARVARASGYAVAMRDLPRDTAKSIAKKLCWNPLRLDEFDQRVAFQIFDANYNVGHPVISILGQHDHGEPGDASRGEAASRIIGTAA